MLADTNGSKPSNARTSQTYRSVAPRLGATPRDTELEQSLRGDFFAPQVPGVLSSQQADQTAQSIAECQLSNGMIPRFVGGVSDPWNHVEAAMALVVAGRRAEAEAAYGWLARMQRHDGSWHQYYTAKGVDKHKLDTNTIAYIATGVWHHWLRFGDRSFVTEMWPVVERAIDFVLALQTPRGEIVWACRATERPWSFALLTGSSSISHSLRCALAIADLVGKQRPSWELAVGRLVHTIKHHRSDAFAQKDRWAMDWYYPVLAGAMSSIEGRELLATRREVFVHEGRGVRCVSDHDWVTTAETCECSMAYLAAGDRETALNLFTWIQQLRQPDGSYLTGWAFPDNVSYPDRECTTYSSAAMLLAADALDGSNPTSALFAHQDALPAPLHLTSNPQQHPALN